MTERHDRPAPDGARQPSADPLDVCLRFATADDEASLLELTNDPVVRAFSFSPDPVQPGAHHAWLAGKLGSPDALIWVATRGDDLVGTVRYERRGGAAEIGLAVASQARGQGLGTWLVASTSEPAAVKLDVPLVRGIVMVENDASAKALLKAGFEEVLPGCVVAGRNCRVFERLRHDSTNIQRMCQE